MSLYLAVDLDQGIANHNPRNWQPLSTIGNMMAARQDNQRPKVPLIRISREARQGGLCDALSASQLTELSRVSTRREVPVGTDLSDDEAYLSVLSGAVKLTRSLSDGRQQIVGFHFAPDFLGRPYRTQWPIKTTTLTKVVLCSFPKAIIERMMEDSPALGHLLLKRSLSELDEARSWIAALGHKTASEKAASFLLMVAKKMDVPNNPDGSLSFDLPLTRADIGDFLGVTIETVSRELTKLRADGVIRIANKRHISLESIAQLADRCGD